MILIYDAPDYLLEGQRWLEEVRARNLHLVCPALTGQPDSHAYQSLDGALPNEKIEDCCTRVNNAVDIGSTWPVRYVSLLPIPPHSDKADWYKIFLDMFKVHYMKDQSRTILVLLDAGVYADTAYLRGELERAGRDYDTPNDRKVPLAYFHAEN